MVQAPADDIVTVVVSVFEGDADLQLRTRIAVTIWERIYLEHILSAIGFYDAVLGLRATHRCWAWYGTEPSEMGPTLARERWLRNCSQSYDGFLHFLHHLLLLLMVSSYYNSML